MAYNSKLLGRANARLDGIRESNLEEHNRRVASVYRKHPEIAAYDDALRAQMIRLAKLAASRDSRKRNDIAALREENLDLQVKRAEALTAAGYPTDWLDDIFSCPVCQDSGRLKDGSVCECLKKLYNRELTAELSSLLKNGNESFENFNIGLYPDEYVPEFSCVPREYMKKVCSLCKSYAELFPGVASGLLFCGGPGLGKTYLSACIARVVAEKGCSVCYETAVAAFRTFEKQQFGATREEQEEAAARVRQMLSCDLLILDDLGTEVVTPSVLSALYTFINTRENEGRHMIISTACRKDELARRYTPSICSRLEGFFQTVTFAGSDIRLLLRGRR